MDLEQKIAKAITSKLYLHFRADFIAAGMPPPPPPVPMQEAVAADIVRSVLSCIKEEYELVPKKTANLVRRLAVIQRRQEAKKP
jgi:hypothetical protein